MDVPTVGPKLEAPARTSVDTPREREADSFSQYLDDPAPTQRPEKKRSPSANAAEERADGAPSAVADVGVNTMMFIPSAAGLFGAAPSSESGVGAATSCSALPASAPGAPLTLTAETPTNTSAIETAAPFTLSVPSRSAIVGASTPPTLQIESAPMSIPAPASATAPVELGALEGQSVSSPREDASPLVAPSTQTAVTPTQVRGQTSEAKMTPLPQNSAEAFGGAAAQAKTSSAATDPVAAPLNAGPQISATGAPAAAAAALVMPTSMLATAVTPAPALTTSVTTPVTPKTPNAEAASPFSTEDASVLSDATGAPNTGTPSRKSKAATPSQTAGAGAPPSSSNPSTGAAPNAAPSGPPSPIGAPSHVSGANVFASADSMTMTPLAIDTDAPTAPTTSLHQSDTRLGATTNSAAASAATSSQRAAAPHMQLAQHIVRRFDGGSTTLEVRLDPVELGRIDVRIEVGRDRRVGVAIAAENPATLTEIARSSRDLERILEAAGLDVSGGGLTFSLAQEQNSHQSSGQDGAARAHEISATDSLDTPAPPPARPFGLESWRVGRIDILA